MQSAWQAFLTERELSNDSDARADIAAARAGTVVAAASHLALIRVAGQDAAPFLHGQLTQDIAGLAATRAAYAGYCSAKGRLLATFLLWREDESSDFILQTVSGLRDSIQKRLAMYVLRSKASLSADERIVLGVAGPEAAALIARAGLPVPGDTLATVRHDAVSVIALSADRFQITAPLAAARELWSSLTSAPGGARPVGSVAWQWLDIQAGIAWITPATQDQFVPQMVNLELIGGVSFQKGCYPGQEIVARAQYRGKVKRRMLLTRVTSETSPKPGDELFADTTGDQASGMVVAAAPAPDTGYDVLAVVSRGETAGEAIHLGSITGPPLRELDLPYTLP